MNTWCSGQKCRISEFGFRTNLCLLGNVAPWFITSGHGNMFCQYVRLTGIPWKATRYIYTEQSRTVHVRCCTTYWEFQIIKCGLWPFLSFSCPYCKLLDLFEESSSNYRYICWFFKYFPRSILPFAVYFNKLDPFFRAYQITVNQKLSRKNRSNQSVLFVTYPLGVNGPDEVRWWMRLLWDKRGHRGWWWAPVAPVWRSKSPALMVVQETVGVDWDEYAEELDMEA